MPAGLMAEERLVALDTETTGRGDDGTPGEHRIIEVGCVEIMGRKITGNKLQLYINPEREVDKEAQEVHGMSWDSLRGCPKFAEVGQQIIDFIRGSKLLIHNARFDTSFLDKEWLLMGITEQTAQMAEVVDTVSLAMKLLPGHQVNLDNLCKLMGVDRSARTLHGALLDAQLLAEVYLAMTGGQTSMDFGETKTVAGQSWVRPQGYTLPRIKVGPQDLSAHYHQMVPLSQAHSIERDGVKLCGSDWGPEFDMEQLTAQEGEDKGAFKARQKAQREQKLQELLHSHGLESAYQDYLAAEKEADRRWEERLGAGA